MRFVLEVGPSTAVFGVSKGTFGLARPGFAATEGRVPCKVASEFILVCVFKGFVVEESCLAGKFNGNDFPSVGPGLLGSVGPAGGFGVKSDFVVGACVFVARFEVAWGVVPGGRDFVAFGLAV